VANTSSAIKRIRSSARKRRRNILVRSSVRTAVKKAVTATGDAAADSMESVRSAASALDRAVSKGVMHKNSAARRKSRLMKRLQKSSKA
jgi:small subunit ribosomal protein S20